MFKEEFKRQFFTAAAVILACFALYLAFSFPSWKEPIMGDEVILALSMRMVLNPSCYLFQQFPTLGLWHPPAYVHLIAFLGKYFGINAYTARAVGVASFLVSLVLIYLTVMALLKNNRNTRPAAFLACVFFALNPLAVRGSLLIDIDGSILNAALLLCVYVFCRTNYETMTARRYLLCGSVFALALWTKLTTPALLMASLLLYQLLTRKIINVFKLFIIGIIGAGLFCATWWLYSYFQYKSFFHIFVHSINSINVPGAYDGKTFLLARSAWALIMWCSPSFILLSLAAAWDTLRGEDAADGALMSLKQLAWYGLVVLFFYLIVGGTAYSFPKYHFAILPVFSILIAVYLSKEISFNRQIFKKSAAVVLFFLIYGVFIVKDPLYLINYALKENIILAGGASRYDIVFKAVMQFIFSVLAIPIGFLLFRWLKEKKALLLSLGVTIIGLNLALSLVQSRAAYNTVYCYGAKGVKETVDFVRMHTNIKEPISAPPEIIWLANDNVSSYVISRPNQLFSPEVFLRTVREGHLQCVVYGITGNTLGQYRSVLNSDQVQRFLENGYIRHSIGSYTIWIKKI